MEKLIKLVEEWSINKGLDKAESSNMFATVDGFPHHVITNDGRLFVTSYVDLNGRTRKTKEIKQRLNKDGYPCVKLTYFGKKLNTRVHRLVAESFVYNEGNKETVNHIDGNKENNHYSNLEWADRSEQLKHAYDLGLKKYNNNTKIKSKEISGKPVKITIKETGEIKYFLTARDCSRSFGYSERWADKIISSSNGETKKFKIIYVDIQELKENTDKLDFSTLVELVSLWSYDKWLHLSDPTKQYLKVSEECSEIAAGLARSDMNAIKDGIGDTVVTLIILSQQIGLTLEECLQCAYDEIKGRTGKMVGGVFVKSSDLK